MSKSKKSVLCSKHDNANISARALYLTLGAVVGTVMLTGTALTATNVSADVTDNLSINIEDSCTMSSVGNNTHNASLVGGQYVTGIGTTTVTVQCADQDGFAVYAVGYSNLEYGNNTLRGPANTEQSGYHTIESRTFSPGGGSTDSGWSMHLSAVEGTYAPTITSDGGYDSEDLTDDRYVTVPNYWTKVAYYEAATDISDEASSETFEGSSFTTTYAVYANPGQHPGAYLGKVRYTLVHPEDTDTPAEIANNYENIHLMQDVSEWGDMLREGEEAYARDSRDGTVYTVARLADGNLWMTQNLDLNIFPEGAYNSDNYRYTPFTNENTDLGWNGAEYATASWTPSNGTISDISEWQNREYAPESYDPGNGEYDISGTSDDHYLLGNYYNWAAAVAMNDTYSLREDEGLYPVEQSICPRGWTLPRAGTGQGSFDAMLRRYGLEYEVHDLALIGDELAPRFAFSGELYYDGSEWQIDNKGSRAFYWTAVKQHTDPIAEEIGGGYENSTRYVYTVGNYDQGKSSDLGLSVRCIARPVASETQGIYH